MIALALVIESYVLYKLEATVQPAKSKKIASHLSSMSNGHFFSGLICTKILDKGLHAVLLLANMLKNGIDESHYRAARPPRIQFLAANCFIHKDIK